MLLHIGLINTTLFSHAMLFSIFDDPVNVIFLIAILLIFIIAVLYHDASKKSEKQENITSMMNAKTKSEKDFKASQSFTSVDLEAKILLDENQKKIMILSNKHQNKHGHNITHFENKYDYEVKTFPYKDILLSEIIEDEISVSRSERGSQLGGAVLGGLIGGGLGAVIGGVTGKKNSINEVNKIELQIVVNDTDNPCYRVAFLSLGFPVKKSSSFYTDAFKNVNHWHNLLKVIIRQADEEDRTSKLYKEAPIVNTEPNQSHDLELRETKPDIADQLLKMHNLLQQNIITQDEFEAHKKHLLSKK